MLRTFGYSHLHPFSLRWALNSLNAPSTKGGKLALGLYSASYPLAVFPWCVLWHPEQSFKSNELLSFTNEDFIWMCPGVIENSANLAWWDLYFSWQQPAGTEQMVGICSTHLYILHLFLLCPHHWSGDQLLFVILYQAYFTHIMFLAFTDLGVCKPWAWLSRYLITCMCVFFFKAKKYRKSSIFSVGCAENLDLVNKDLVTNVVRNRQREQEKPDCFPWTV